MLGLVLIISKVGLKDYEYTNPKIAHNIICQNLKLNILRNASSGWKNPSICLKIIKSTKLTIKFNRK